MKNFLKFMSGVVLLMGTLLICSLVNAQSTISGTVIYMNNASTPLDGLRLYLVDISGAKIDTTYTDEDGHYCFNRVPDGMYLIEPECQKSWGGGNSADAMHIMKHFVGITYLTGLKLAAADPDGSANVNANDGLTVIKRFVNMINLFPSGDWVFEHDTLSVSGKTAVTHDFNGLCCGDVNGSYTPPQCYPYPTVAEAGPDQVNVPGTSVMLGANIPQSGTGTWCLAEGQGGSFADPSQPTTMFTGTAGTEYTLVWTITTACFASTDTVVINFQAPPGACPGLATLSFEGQTYHTIQIGIQCWLRENLNAGTMINSSQPQLNNGVTEKYCYNNDPANCLTYGGLYNWDELMQYRIIPSRKGICPQGWHLPSDEEWCTLVTWLDTTVNCGNYGMVGPHAGGKMKETGTDHWASPNTGATNSSGFTALGAGNGNLNGNFVGLLGSTSYFTSSWGDDGVFRWYLSTGEVSLKRTAGTGNLRFSARCVRNECSAGAWANAGSDQQNVTATAIQLAANQPGAGEVGTWEILNGAGGGFYNVNDPLTHFYGQAGEIYTLRWTVEGICDTAFDDVQVSFSPAGGTPTVTYEGQTYHTVRIGNQTWFMENLNVGTMLTAGQFPSNNAVVEKYCYDQDPANCAVFGGLYTWDEMMQYQTVPGSMGICPSGWQLPSREDWCRLILHLDPNVGCDDLNTANNAGIQLKEAGFEHWIRRASYPANNRSGFTAIGAGVAEGPTFYENVFQNTYLWSSSENGNDRAWANVMTYLSPSLSRSDYLKSLGFSVRCMKYDCPPSTLAEAGPDQYNVSGNTATMAANSPVTGETGTWTVAAGTLGSFQDLHDPGTVFTGLPDSVYTLRWTISNGCDSNYNDVIVSFHVIPIPSCPGLPTIEYEGRTYHTVQIGPQCWLRENLNVGVMVNSSQPGYPYSDCTNNAVVEKYCYDNNPANCEIYGGLYDWNEMMNYNDFSGQGICPAGWHIPSDWDYLMLITNYAGDPMVSGGNLKETGFAHWDAPNGGATNSTGFTALGAGMREETGIFSSLRQYTYFWSTEYLGYSMGGGYWLNYSGPGGEYFNQSRTTGLSVRCIKY